MDRRVVSAQTVLVVSVVDDNLDGHGGINQTDNGGWNANEVGVSAVGGIRKSVNQ